MKDFYHISEISRLYGVGVDSLRYYERLGILHPKRDTNGYRLYSLMDIYKLNIIRDLRKLDFSMEQIKRYLDGQSVENTLRLLSQERELLRRQRKLLREREAILRGRMDALRAACALPIGETRVLTLPERRCVRLQETITRDEEMDIVIKKLHRKHEDSIRDFASLTIGAFLSEDALARGQSHVFTSVFFILERTTPDCDFTLPAGAYLSCCYRGAYAQNGAYIEKMRAHASKAGIALAGAPFELYRVDNRDTAREEEFITELQARIATPQEGMVVFTKSVL